MKDYFKDYHPAVNLIYFALVISFSMVMIHPLAQIVALIGALGYFIGAEGKKALGFVLKICLPTLFLTALVNPIFNHEGETILCYLGGKNPLTLESIFYGLGSCLMLVTVVLWFSSFSRVMSSDKFIYLFGKLAPALSLVLSMSLRLVPKFKNQAQKVAEAQKCIGRDLSSGGIWQKIKTATVIFSVMITWALENAIESSDSMKSRGYGLKGRTSFSIYTVDEQDKYTLIWLLFCGLFLMAGSIVGAFEFDYFPSIAYRDFDMTTIPFYFVYFALCITPSVLNFAKEKKWKTLYSRI